MKMAIGSKGDTVDRLEVVEQLEKMASMNVDVSEKDRAALSAAVEMLRDDEDVIVLTDSNGDVVAEIDGELASSVMTFAVQKYVTEILMKAVEGSV